MPSDRREQEKRKLAIVKILKEDEPITQQKDLVRKLKEMGIPATQSSVSRDLSEIGAVRIRGEWMLIGIYDVGVFERAARFVTEVRFAGPNNTLLKTLPGAGPFVADALEESGWEEIEGVLPGPDSVLVLTHDAFFQKIVSTRLQGYLREGLSKGGLVETEGMPWRVTRQFT